MLHTGLLSLLLAANAHSPLRTLKYSFHVAGQTEGISHYGGIGTGLPGVDTTYALSGYDGEILAEVMATGPGRSLVVRLTQTVPKAHTLDQPPGLCAVYPDGHVQFDSTTTKFRTPELALARFLGRAFINGDLIDDKNHWLIAYQVEHIKVRSDFTIAKNDNGILAIDERGTMADGMNETTTIGRLTYDLNRTIPLSIHEESTTIYGSGSVRNKLDYTLIADSLAR